MFYTVSDRRRQRPGMVLLVVIAMLTLFSIVALSFVFYAESEAVASQLTSDSMNVNAADVDPESLLSFFIRELTYDTTNTGSALRGHSLARTMYGFNPVGANATPYSGIGRLHATYPGNDPAFPGADDYFIPNYTFFVNDGIIRDPEYYYPNSAGTLGSYRASNQPMLPAQYRAGNASYTYPDMNSLFLARVDADGSVIAPSFHRSYLAPNPALAPPNKYSVLFPSQAYHANFVTPDADAGGHVRNLDLGRGTKICTSISALSNGSSLPQGVINVVSTNGFPQMGTIGICTSGSLAGVSYSSITSTSFVGCTPIGGGGLLSAGQPVVPIVASTQISAGGQALPQSMILVNSTNNFSPSGGVISINASGMLTSVTYQSLQANPPAFLGCQGGTGVLTAGAAVLANVYATNDSYWMDLGWPVMTARNGKKFKPLFAPLVLDLDNRVNLMVSGNARAANGISLSNKGYGPTEINLTNLTAVGLPGLSALVSNPPELAWLFGQRNVTPPLSASANAPLLPQPPYPPTAAPWFWSPPVWPPRQWPLRDGPAYASIDFDGINGGRLTLPNPYNPSYPSQPLFYAFPDYPNNLPLAGVPTWYSNGFPPPAAMPLQLGSLELFQHPLSYNYMADSRALLRASALETALRLKGTSGPTSPFVQNMPNTFNFDTTRGIPSDRFRSMLTALSANLDRITGAPYLPYNPAQQTVIGPASNNQPLPQPIINVGSTVGFPQLGGQIAVNVGGTITLVTYTGTTATSFVGCGGGVGLLSAGQAVTTANYLNSGVNPATAPPAAPGTYYPTVVPQSLYSPNFLASPIPGSEFASPYYPYAPTQSALGMPTVSTVLANPPAPNPAILPCNLPQLIIPVASTYGFPRAGTLAINVGGSLTFVTYTGITATSFIGCVGGKGTLAAGNQVAPYLGSRLRVNLNNIASSKYDYPSPDANGFIDLTQLQILTQFTAAQTARQQLAYDVYYVLVSATGALDPNQYGNMKTIAPQQFQAAQWLAQLAVNIVDYTDGDDIATPFNWFKDPITGITETVYGTELPRLVLSEVYAQLDNDGNDPGLAANPMKATTNYNLNVWAELHNPFKNALLTTISAASNGQVPQAAGVINVASTAGFPSSGTLVIGINGTPTTVAYTGTTLTSFTGCVSTGTVPMTAGQRVLPLLLTTTVTIAAPLSFGPGAGVLYVSSTAGFPTAGTFAVSGATPVIVSYTSLTPTAFCGCTVISSNPNPLPAGSTLAPGQVVSVQAQPLDAGVARLNVGMPLAATTIAAASNNAPISQALAATVTVTSTAGFQNSGMLLVSPAAGRQFVMSYTGITGNTFTGCLLAPGYPTGTSATLATGQQVTTYNAAYQIALEAQDGSIRVQLTTANSDRNRGEPSNPLNGPSIWSQGNQPNGPVSVMPANGAFATDGFFVAGPAPATSTFFPGRDPQLLPPNPQTSGPFSQSTPMAAPLVLNANTAPLVFPNGQADNNLIALKAGATVLLRRLACPYLLPDPNPSSATYNPYITIDYVNVVPAYNLLATDQAPGGNLPAEYQYQAVGRKQPYQAVNLPPPLPAPQPLTYLVPQQPYTTVTAASNGQNIAKATTINVVSTLGYPASGNINVNITGNQLVTYTGTTATSFTGCSTATGMGNLATAQTVTPATQPQNTFFRHNSALNNNPQPGDPTLQIPFDWLVHLDRPVVNAMELAHVSGFRPHELTQQFVTAAGKFQHYAPWIDQPAIGSALISRALELLGVPSYLNGTASGGRVPGKLNVNTMNEVEIWRALCDQNPMSSFSASDVDLVYRRLILSRTASGVGGAPTPYDRPFRSSTAMPVLANDTQYPFGAGQQDTLLRMGLTDPSQTLPAAQNNPVPLFTYGTPTVPQPLHPYQQGEMLQKITNNVTTNSNVFAVWLTVGFFEVVNDQVTPPLLGAELGRDQGRQIRHRMFAIVDRTGLNLAQAFAPNGISAGLQAVPVVANTLLPPAPTGAPAVPAVLNTMVGNQVDVGPDPVTGQSEVVTVTAVAFSSNGIGGAQAGTIVANFKRSYNANTPIVFRGNPGPQPRSMTSLTTAAAASGSNQVTVSGTVANLMLGDLVTIGGDPYVVSAIDTTNPATPLMQVQGGFTKNYPAGTPVVWTSAMPYQARNDPGVVLYLSVVK